MKKYILSIIFMGKEVYSADIEAESLKEAETIVNESLEIDILDLSTEKK